MTLVGFYGDKRALIGPDPWNTTATAPATTALLLDAANEAIIYIGHMVTSDGASHTINTTGSSSIGYRTGAVTFANGTTVVKVGIGSVITTAGPPARANNAADVITFDVNSSHTGGGGGITANAWQTAVPSTGTKTIANGDLVAISIQMTARGGVDAVNINSHANAAVVSHRPTVTSFTGAAYSALAVTPNAFVTFSDGATGWLSGGHVYSAITALTTFNTGSTPDEAGQLFQLPFPTKIYGIYGWVDPDNDFDVILYSDPLGTPAAQKTVSIDLNVVAAGSGRRFEVLFDSPYQTTADQVVAAIIKPTTASNTTVYYKTLASATQRVVDPWGTSGYGVTRTDGSGAFANANSSLDHFYLGLIAGAFDNAVSTTPVAKITSLQRGTPY